LWAEFDVHLFGHGLETFVICPQAARGNVTGRQDLDINQTDAASHQPVALYEQECFIIVRFGCFRQRVQQSDDFLPVLQIAARQFPKDERMHGDPFRLEKRRESAACFPEVINPNGCVHEDHYAVLRRGTPLAAGSDPPKAANRRALQRATKASSPMWTKEVFSFTPVRWEAFLRIASSMLSVVFMHTNMADMDVSINQPTASNEALRVGRRAQRRS
jgi:hypothetical protein